MAPNFQATQKVAIIRPIDSRKVRAITCKCSTRASAMRHERQACLIDVSCCRVAPGVSPLVSD